MEEELKRYLIIYVYNERYDISLELQIVKEESILDAASNIQCYDLYNNVIKKDLEKEIMIMQREERRSIMFDEKYSDDLERVFFEYCYIVNIDNIDELYEDISLASLNNKHGILDTKIFSCIS